MARETVTFKGTKDGLAIVIDEQADFGEALDQLRGKLAQRRDFFAGASVRIAVGSRGLLPDEWRKVREIVAQFGLVLGEEGPQRGAGRAADGGPAGDRSPSPPRAPEEQTLLVRRTLRSGQRIEYAGNVVVLGDVNPGAVVTCSGDILVLGTLRGVAHAGATGKTDAIVMAFRLEPTQLRIAHFISRAPDGTMVRSQGPEVATVRGDRIEIAAYAP